MMAYDYFKSKLDVESHSAPFIEKWLIELFDLESLKFIGKTEDGIREGKDYVGYTQGGNRLTFEVKARDSKYKFKRDILAETISNSAKKTLGWIKYSRADYLVYVFLTSWNSIGRKYVLSMQDFRKWFMERELTFKYIQAPNPPWKPEYYTISAKVPISDIPTRLFYYPKERHI